MKCVVFGASVSAQTVHHVRKEVSGYCEVLRRSYLQRLGATSLVQVCYAGNRLSDGGLFRLMDVVKQGPAVCIVEPLVEDTSRGTNTTRAEALFVYQTLLEARILPISLFLPQPARRTPTVWPAHALFNGICKEYGLPKVEIDLTGVNDLDKKFEGVHTKPDGAELYAKLFASGISRMGNLQEFGDRLFSSLPSLRSGLYETSLLVPASEKLHRIAVRLKSEANVPFGFRVIQGQFIGPFSPMIRVESIWSGPSGSGKAESERSVWDPYCHYERRSYVVLEDRQLEGATQCEVSVSVIADDPAYSQSRRAAEGWPAPADRYLKPWSEIKVFSTSPLTAALLDCS